MDKDLKALIESAIDVGLLKIPAGVPDHIKTLASSASKSALEYLISQLEPKSLKLTMKKGAKATAKIV